MKSTGKLGIIDAVLEYCSGAGGEPDGESRNGEIEEPFVPDDEQVIRLLSDSDGYTWQGDIVGSLGWSEPKTSRTLSSMEEEGRITRYQIGRQNVVCLPHREPECLRTKRNTPIEQ